MTNKDRMTKVASSEYLVLLVPRIHVPKQDLNLHTTTSHIHHGQS